MLKSRIQPENKVIQDSNKMNVLEMFLLRKKLGIQQDVTESDLQIFKNIDMNASKGIKATPSPMELLQINQLK